MAEAASRQRWRHTSELLAALYNSNPLREGPAATPAQFDPFSDVNRNRDAAEAETDLRLEAPITALRDLYVKNPPQPAARG